MAALNFPGKEKMIAALDAAVMHGNDQMVVDAACTGLVRVLQDSAVVLPREIFAPVAGHYARRELHTSTEHGYEVIAMTWAPGQGTPLHDHYGGWCVEGVVQGELAVNEYDLLESHGDQFRFEKSRYLVSTVGTAAGLVAPQEFHTIHNPSESDVAVSIHIYPRPLTRFHVFTPVSEKDGWYQRTEMQPSKD